MIKEQVLILKVKYDNEQDQTPNTWNWTGIVGSGHEVEVINYSPAEETKSKD